MKSGVSAVWLAHLLWEQRVGGSNPSRPTKFLFQTPAKPQILTRGRKVSDSGNAARIARCSDNLSPF